MTITDNRTGKTIEVPIKNGTIAALNLKDLGLRYLVELPLLRGFFVAGIGQ